MHRYTAILLLASALGHAQAGRTLADLDRDEFRYSQQKLWDKDAEALKDIIAVWSARMGPNAVGLSQYYSKLGTALAHNQDYAGAEQAFRSAISLLQANGPLYDEAAVRVKRKLVKVLNEQNKTDEAYELKKSLPPAEPGSHYDVQAQLIAKAGEAQYTTEARQNDVSGAVSVFVKIDETGAVKDVQVIEPLGFGLDENAINAVRNWKFRPALQNGTPVATSATAQVSFRDLNSAR